MKVDKKGTARIKFTARSPEDLFDYNIRIFSNGSASIDVSMQNRQSISFMGDLIMKDSK